MIKTLFLQSMYNCLDEVMKRELYNRIDFRIVQEFPEIIPGSGITWIFRKRPSSTVKDKIMWKYIWKQLEECAIPVKKGAIQGVAFIESEPGKHGREKPSFPRIRHLWK